MRSSKTVRRQKDLHISGAEGLYKQSEIEATVKGYIERAFTHPRGRADKIVITIENVPQKPALITSLPLVTADCQNPAEGRKTASRLLASLGVAAGAIDGALDAIEENSMRGAAIIDASTGKRLEPDRERGVRVSRLGISKQSLKSLSLRLSRYGINTDTVKEALVLASKAMSHKDLIAELCVSDDPDYTTGYVASREFGYVRIPHIKRKGSKKGGRAFFVRRGAKIDMLIDYLEKVPVMIGEISSCRGILSLEEILDPLLRLDAVIPSIEKRGY